MDRKTVGFGMIIAGIIMLIPGLILSFLGSPITGEEDLAITVFEAIRDTDLPHAEETAQSGINAMNILSLAPYISILIGVGLMVL